MNRSYIHDKIRLGRLDICVKKTWKLGSIGIEFGREFLEGKRGFIAIL